LALGCAGITGVTTLLGLGMHPAQQPLAYFILQK
jgi:hypothetical protein